jgi:hypothetical protein
MPFTMSHAAAVLPFYRPLARWRVLSAVVIGSMVPDFHIFAPWPMERFETHSAAALFTFSLPVGLLCYWVFQYLIKVPMIEVLPDAAFVRWRPFEAPAPIESLRQWIVAGVGVLAGAVTHLVWDAFTHEGARGVRMLPIQDERLFDVGHHHVLFTRVMQDLSSLVGLLIVAAVVSYALRPSKAEPAAPTRILAAGERRAWVSAMIVSSIVLWIAFLASSYLEHGNPRVGWLIYEAALASLRALATAIILFGALLQRRLRVLNARAAT